MKLWDNIRNYFYKKSLAEKLNTHQPVRQLINFDDARSIGIIYDSSVPGNDAIVAEFAEGLRGANKTVDILGYIADKKVLSKEGIEVLHATKVNWARIPKDERAEKFADRKFDILFAAFIGEHYPLEYIAGITQSRWRVGVYNDKKTELFDLMVSMGDKKDLRYFLDQAVYFLKEIKYDSK